MLTARGQTADEFRRNLQAIRGLLDQPQALSQPVAQPQGEGWCAVHGVQMRWNAGQAGRKGWYSHKTPEGWCKGR